MSLDNLEASAMPPTPLALGGGGKILSGIRGLSIMHLLLQVFCQMNSELKAESFTNAW